MINQTLGTKVRSGSLKAKVTGISKRTSSLNKNNPRYVAIKQYAKKYGQQVSTDQSQIEQSFRKSQATQSRKSTQNDSIVISRSRGRSLQASQSGSFQNKNKKWGSNTGSQDRSFKVSHESSGIGNQIRRGGQSFLPYAKVKPKRKNYYDEYQIGIVQNIMEESSIMRSGYDITFLKDKSHVLGLSDVSQNSKSISKGSNCAQRNFQVSTKK